MSDRHQKWAEFDANLPDELLYPNLSDSALSALIDWPSGIFASWHYWKYLQSQNPYHGLHVSVILQKYPDHTPKNLLIDSVYQTWIDSKNLHSRKNAFFKASNQFLLLLSAQQLNIICQIPLEDCCVRVMAKSDSLNRPFNKASTCEKEYRTNKRENPVFQRTERVLKELASKQSFNVSDDSIDAFLNKFPTSSKIGIVGAIYD